jgi:hypothetical protein
MAQDGGFLLSPPQSNAGSSINASSLPHPRDHALAPGSSKEASFLRFVNQSIDRIQQRYANRTGTNEIPLEDNGYTNFKEVAQDFERLVDMIWVSGTRKNHSSSF